MFFASPRYRFFEPLAIRFIVILLIPGNKDDELWTTSANFIICTAKSAFFILSKYSPLPTFRVRQVTILAISGLNSCLRYAAVFDCVVQPGSTYYVLIVHPDFFQQANDCFWVLDIWDTTTFL